MFLVDGHEERRTPLRAEADELPRATCSCSAHGCAATASCRSASPSRRRCTATSAAGRCTGCCACKHITQDDAHIFCTEEQIQDEIAGMVDYVALPLRPVRARAAAPSSRRGPDKRLGTDEEWDLAEGALEAALKRHGLEYVIGEGEGAFYGPKIDLHMTDSLGRSWQMGTIQLDSQMPTRFGLTYVGADNAEHHPVVDPPRAARLARALHRDPRSSTTAARSRSGSRRCRCGSSRSARTTARRPRRSRRSSRPTYRVEVDDSRRDRRQADPQRRAREDPLRDRLRRQGVGRVARGPRARRRAAHARALLTFSASLLRYGLTKQERTASSPPGPRASRRFNRVVTTRNGPLRAAVFRLRTRRSKHDLVRAT